MAVSNSTTLNDLVGEIVSEEALSAAIDTRVMRQLVNSQQMPMGAGSMVIPRFTDVAVGSLTEGVAPSSTQWSTDGTTLTPVERGVYVQISKRVLFADPFSDLAPYGEQLGKQLGEDEDAQMLALIAGSTDTSINASGAMTGAALLSGVANLESAGAPGPYYCVLHPTALAQLRSDIGDASVFATPGKEIVEGLGDRTTTALNGYAGSPYGIPVYTTNQVASAGLAHSNIVASQKYLSHAYIQDLTVDVDDNVTARAFDLMAWYGAHQAITASDWGVEIIA